MESHAIELITDTTCDIPQELIDKYGIIVLPHTIIWGEEQYRDRADLQPQDFYQRLNVDRQWPTTSQITVQAFVEAFQQSKERGVSEIVVITLSSTYSG